MNVFGFYVGSLHENLSIYLNICSYMSDVGEYMTDVEILEKVAEKAAKFAEEMGLNQQDNPDLIAFRDPAKANEALAVPFHEEIQKMFEEANLEFTLIKSDDYTSMRISKLTLHHLETIKEHPKEPMESVIKRMISFWDGHSNCEVLKKPMSVELVNIIKNGLEHKFGSKVTEIEDTKQGTVFHLEGKPEGTPVLIPKR